MAIKPDLEAPRRQPILLSLGMLLRPPHLVLHFSLCCQTPLHLVPASDPSWAKKKSCSRFALRRPSFHQSRLSLRVKSTSSAAWTLLLAFATAWPIGLWSLSVAPSCLQPATNRYLKAASAGIGKVWPKSGDLNFLSKWPGKDYAADATFIIARVGERLACWTGCLLHWTELEGLAASRTPLYRLAPSNEDVFLLSCYRLEANLMAPTPSRQSA